MLFFIQRTFVYIKTIYRYIRPWPYKLQTFFFHTVNSTWLDRIFIVFKLVYCKHDQYMVTIVYKQLRNLKHMVCHVPLRNKCLTRINVWKLKIILLTWSNKSKSWRGWSELLITKEVLSQYLQNSLHRGWWNITLINTIKTKHTGWNRNSMVELFLLLETLY